MTILSTSLPQSNQHLLSFFDFTEFLISLPFCLNVLSSFSGSPDQKLDDQLFPLIFPKHHDHKVVVLWRHFFVVNGRELFWSTAYKWILYNHVLLKVIQPLSPPSVSLWPTSCWSPCLDMLFKFLFLHGFLHETLPLQLLSWI